MGIFGVERKNLLRAAWENRGFGSFGRVTLFGGFLTLIGGLVRLCDGFLRLSGGFVTLGVRNAVCWEIFCV